MILAGSFQVIQGHQDDGSGLAGQFGPLSHEVIISTHKSAACILMSEHVAFPIIQ